MTDKSLNFRKDHRSLDQFKEDILRTTQREKMLLEYWIAKQAQERN